MLGQHQVQAARGRSNLPGAKLIGGGRGIPAAGCFSVMGVLSADDLDHWR